MKKSEQVSMIPLKTNLLQQNCFVSDMCRGVVPTHLDNSKYVSLDEVTTEKGIELRETVNDYPITPEYVDSFAESADYKSDVAGAIAKGSSRPNLGDISSMQKVLSMDTEQARALYTQLSERFAQKSTPQSSVDTINKDGDK